eukprot:5827727-Prymnesium_polylepis.1
MPGLHLRLASELHTLLAACARRGSNRGVNPRRDSSRGLAASAAIWTETPPAAGGLNRGLSGSCRMSPPPPFGLRSPSLALARPLSRTGTSPMERALG